MAGLAGGTTYGYPGAWSQDRIEQALHFRHWTYISVRAVCQTIAGLEPRVAYVERGVDPTGDSIKREFVQHRYRSTLKSIRPDENIIPCPEGHPLIQLLEYPNAWDTAADLWYELFLFLELHGNGYLWVVPNRFGLPSELWVIPSHWVWPHMTREGIDYYEVRPFIGPGTLKFPADEVIHVRYKSPLHKIDGWSPQQAGSEWIDAAESVDRSRYWQFKNGCFPIGHVELSEAYHDPDDAELERVYAKFFARIQGEANYGKPIITPPGVKYNPLTIAPAEMAYVDSATQLRDWVLALFGVPKEIAGIQDAGSEIAMYGPLVQFMTFTIAPKLRYLSQVLTRHLASRFPQPDSARLRIWWDDPTPNSPAQINSDLSIDAQHGWITPNEARAIRGRQPYSEEEEKKYAPPAGGGDKEQAAAAATAPNPPGKEGSDASSSSAGSGSMAALLGGAIGKAILSPDVTKAAKGTSKNSEFERKHKRDADGKFSSTGGGGSGGSNKGPQATSQQIEQLKRQRQQQQQQSQNKRSPEQPVRKPTPFQITAKNKHVESLVRSAAQALQSTNGLTSKQKQEYARSVYSVVARMPLAAAARVADNLKSFRFAASLEQVTDERIKLTKELAASGSKQTIKQAIQIARDELTRLHGESVGARFDKQIASNPAVMKKAVAVGLNKMISNMKSKSGSIGGLYASSKKTVVLDGGTNKDTFTIDGVLFMDSQSSIYAHEITHAIDGPEKMYSSSAEWREAFEQEIATKNRPLSKYAATSTAEAFAEFGRLIYTPGNISGKRASVDLATVEKRFPKASAFFKANGLWPEQQKTSKSIAKSLTNDQPPLSDSALFELFESPVENDPVESILHSDWINTELLLPPVTIKPDRSKQAIAK